MVIDTNFKRGENVWILDSYPSPVYSKFYPLLYGNSIEDNGFFVTVKTKKGNNIKVCRSNCFHTEQEAIKHYKIKNGEQS